MTGDLICGFNKKASVMEALHLVRAPEENPPAHMLRKG
jgi:hypothetical protein